jgi:hypothetical protein
MSMITAKLIQTCVVAVAAMLVITGCSKQAPAQHAVESVSTAVAGVSAAAQKYQPEQFAALQLRVSSLKASFEAGNYQQVLADAPTLLNDTQALGAAAAAKKDQLTKMLSVQWSGLAASIPDRVATVQAQIDTLSKSKKEAAKVDLRAAKASMDDVDALWSKAQESFTAGDLETAVNCAKDVQSKTEAAAVALKLTLPPIAPTH